MWSDIMDTIDVKNPSKEDFDKIHEYLYSDRDEIKHLVDYYDIDNRRVGANIRYCDEHGKYERRHHIGKNRDKVVFIYASHNRKYLDFAEKQYKQILDVGYDGDIIVYFGGYPNMDMDGLKYCNLPMSFKSVGLLECQRLGYKYFMWVDSAVLVQKNFDFIFDLIKEHDFYFNLLNKVRFNHTHDNVESIGFQHTYESMGLDFDKVLERRVFSGGLFGVNLDSAKGKQFVELNQKYLDQGTPFFAPASDLAVMVGILSILYPDSDPPNFPTSIGRSPNIDYFYYDTDH